jgi:inosine-uridine nucleoside N-ribohydrolase
LSWHHILEKCVKNLKEIYIFTKNFRINLYKTFMMTDEIKTEVLVEAIEALLEQEVETTTTEPSTRRRTFAETEDAQEQNDEGCSVFISGF